MRGPSSSGSALASLKVSKCPPQSSAFRWRAGESTLSFDMYCCLTHPVLSSSQEIEDALKLDHVRKFIVSRLDLGKCADVGASVRQVCTFVAGHFNDLTMQLFFQT